MSILLPYSRTELTDMLPVYNMIDDCIRGEQAVKSKTTLYVPKPNPTDNSSANIVRYEQYLARASFFNATGRTLQGLLGSLFLRDPTIVLPDKLQVLAESRNGLELGLTQLARRAAQFSLSFGRSGIFTDFPAVDFPLSVANINADIAPILRVYDPRDILNWRVGRRNGQKLLTFIVLREYVDNDYQSNDAFAPVEKVYAYRTLRLRNNVFEVEYWRSDANVNVVSVPRDFNGNTFDTIPFTFIGSENNDEEFDVPPLEAIAALNIAHFRNSADYEESCYFTGQPTVYFTGLTQEWIETVFNSQPIPMGARHAVPLPPDATAGLIQAAPNTLPFEAMQHKERLMQALGARLTEQRAVQRTATEANLEGVADTSILGAIANNVKDAIITALGFACDYTGTDKDAIEFVINTNLGYVTMSADERRELVAEWQASAITFNELRINLRQAGIATDDDADVIKEAAEKQAQELDKAAQLAQISANAEPATTTT